MFGRWKVRQEQDVQFVILVGHTGFRYRVLTPKQIAESSHCTSWYLQYLDQALARLLQKVV